MSRDTLITNSGEALSGAFLKAMSRVAATVCLVTTDGPHGRNGATVTAMTPVTADGPQPELLICLNKAAHLGRQILGNGIFCVNVLSLDQAESSDIFAGRRGLQQEQRFLSGDWVTMANGSPGLAGAVARLSCRVSGSKRVGSHDVIFGAVEEIQGAIAGMPLLYFHRGYAGVDTLPLQQPARKSA